MIHKLITALAIFFAVLGFSGLAAPTISAAPPPPPPAACSLMTFDRVVVMTTPVFIGGAGSTTRYLVFGTPGSDIIRLQTMGTSCIVGGGGTDTVTAGFGPGDVCYLTPLSIGIGCDTIIP